MTLCFAWGDCPKSQTFLSDNRESAFGLEGYGVFQSREDFSDGRGCHYSTLLATLL